MKICQVLMSSTQLQNMSFHVVERTRTAVKYTKMKNSRVKPPKLRFSFLNMQISEVLVAVVIVLA